MFFYNENLTLRILSVLELSWDEDIRQSANRPFHALSFRTEGDTFFRHQDEVYHVTAGDVAYVPENFTYLQEHKREHLYVVHFEMNKSINGKFFSFSPRNTNLYRNLFKNMYDIWMSKRPGYRHAATAVLYKILEHLEYDVSEEKFFTKDDNMNEVIDYIHENYCDRNISVAHLAEMFGASETYFRRVFKSKFNVTPLKYINSMRLRHAQELLSSGYYSVSAAAEAVGFDDPKYFSRLIKKETGNPPSRL